MYWFLELAEIQRVPKAVPVLEKDSKNLRMNNANYERAREM
jgi:hypothetical protein